MANTRSFFFGSSWTQMRELASSHRIHEPTRTATQRERAVTGTQLCGGTRWSKRSNDLLTRVSRAEDLNQGPLRTDGLLSSSWPAAAPKTPISKAWPAPCAKTCIWRRTMRRARSAHPAWSSAAGTLFAALALCNGHEASNIRVGSSPAVPNGAKKMYLTRCNVLDCCGIFESRTRNFGSSKSNVSDCCGLFRIANQIIRTDRDDRVWCHANRRWRTTAKTLRAGHSIQDQ